MNYAATIYYSFFKINTVFYVKVLFEYTWDTWLPSYTVTEIIARAYARAYMHKVNITNIQKLKKHEF